MDVLLGITTDGSGGVYVCETAGERVVKIDDGKEETWYTGKKGCYPTGLTFKEGVAYILEHKWMSPGYGWPKSSPNGSVG